MADGHALLDLADGDTFDLRLGPVAKQLGDTIVRMLGYNGSIPGPTLKVQQNSEVIVNVSNDGDLVTTVHWHGLRLENKYDGVPHETQTPIPVGGSFTYGIRFPDPGLCWYHPHIRGGLHPGDGPVRQHRRRAAGGRQDRRVQHHRDHPHGDGPFHPV
jgi:FtsP/CotA-like multicopper oxidase with cupredoxin domain